MNFNEFLTGTRHCPACLIFWANLHNNPARYLSCLHYTAKTAAEGQGAQEASGRESVGECDIHSLTEECTSAP